MSYVRKGDLVAFRRGMSQDCFPQVALVLQGGSLVYFELDSDSGLLEEIGGERSVTYVTKKSSHDSLYKNKRSLITTNTHT